MNSIRTPALMSIMVALQLGTSSRCNAGENMPAVAALFDDEILADNVLIVFQRARVPLDVERFEFLSRWVLPSASHQTLRMQIDFTETDLIAPAIDLVEVASKLNRLLELRRHTLAFHPTAIEQRKAQLAFLAIVAIAEKDFQTAEKEMRELLTLAAAAPVTQAERGPEVITIRIADQHPQTSELARELAMLLYTDVIANNGPRSERWHRYIHSLRFQFDTEGGRRFAGNDGQSTSKPLKSWFPVSRVTAETRGQGYAAARWETSPGKATHSFSHDHDYLYFASPLTGNFSVEADLSTFDYHDIHLSFGGVWAGPRNSLDICDNGIFRDDRQGRLISPQLTRVEDSMRARLDVRDGTCTTFINGRQVFQSPRSAHSDPWLSVHCRWFGFGTVSNLRVLGEPVIPSEIELATESDLPGWLAYFNESVGTVNADWYLEAPNARSPESTATLIGRRRAGLEGSACESLLRYHRPMVEDGTIEYEFLYQPGRMEVHPALDRFCFMLTPEGVHLHELTDGAFDRTERTPDRADPLPRSDGSHPLKLKPGEWNKAAISVRGDVAEVAVNDHVVCSQTIPTTNLRTFGLFHFADMTEARVRSLRWKGTWPTTLKPPVEQELADNSLETTLGDVGMLPLVLQHDFRDGLPRERFTVSGAGWEDNLEQLPNGIRLTRPGGDYVNYTISTPMQLQGDFDATVAFEQLETSVVPGGESNIQIVAVLDDLRTSACFLFRKQYLFEGQREENVAHAAIFQKRENETQYIFLSMRAEESRSGQMRLARRGTMLYYLYAENDSTEFRLIHSEDVGIADANIRLVNGQHKDGHASVVWKSLTARGASATGVPPEKLMTIQQLDESRAKLPAITQRDFASSVPRAGTQGLEAFTIWGDGVASFLHGKDGLTIESPGSDQWTAAGLVPKLGFEGDFDISLSLEVLQLEPSKDGDESTVLLQTEFLDPKKSAIEMKFSTNSMNELAAETQLRSLRADGTFDYRERQTSRAGQAILLRLARRDGIVYQVFQESKESAPVILDQMEIGKYPVPPGFMRMLIHTGGANRKTIVTFKQLTVQAGKINGKL